MQERETVLITGGCGFIGSHLVDVFTSADRRYDVHVFDNWSTGRHVNRDATYWTINIANPDRDLSKLITDINPKVIFHLAAIARVQKSFDEPHKYHINNATLTSNLLDSLRKINYKGRVVFTSSSSVYNGRPNIETQELSPVNLSPYALGKLHAEQICALYRDFYGLDIVITRPFSVYGPRMASGSYGTVLQYFIDAFKCHKPLTITGDGSQLRDFTHVEDIVTGLLQCGFAENPPKILNLCSGNPKRIIDIANLFPAEQIFIDKVVEPEFTCGDTTIGEEFGFSAKHNVIDWIKEYAHLE